MTMKIKQFIIIKLIVLFAFSVQAQPAKTKVDERSRVDKWKEDLKFLATELPAKHKNLFFKLKREDFEREVATIEKEIPNLSDKEMKIALMRLVAMIGDGHTSVYWQWQDFSVLPIQFYKFSDGWFVTASTDEYKQAIGARLIRIGKTDVEKAADALKELKGCENEPCHKSFLPNFMRVPEFLHFLKLIPRDDEAAFTFVDKKGKEFTLTIKSLPIAAYEKIKWLTARPAEKAPLYTKNPEQNYWFEFLSETKTLFFKYNRCQQMKEKPFAEFSKELLAFVDSHEIERFIIDLRHNGGGAAFILIPFIFELKKREKINKQGHLFVVIGRGTFSSAHDNAQTLRQYTKATIIGEPSGQKPNSYGEVKTFMLPNSKLEIGYSTKFWKNVEDDPLSMMPDIFVEVSFDDYVNGRDVVFEKILALS